MLVLITTTTTDVAAADFEKIKKKNTKNNKFSQLYASSTWNVVEPNKQSNNSHIIWTYIFIHMCIIILFVLLSLIYLIKIEGKKETFKKETCCR